MSVYIIGVILFGLLNAGIGSGKIPQAIATAIMSCIFLYVFPEEYTPWVFLVGLLLWGLLWGANTFAWSLSALTGRWHGITAYEDWKRKFPLSGYVIKKLHLENHPNEHMVGAVGTSVRWLAFTPAIILVNPLYGIPLGIVLGICAGGIYYGIGKLFHNKSYAEYAARMSEFSIGLILGGIILW